MAGHDLLLTPLAAGALYFTAVDAQGKTERQDYRISGGLAEILKNAVTVYTMSVEKASPAS